MNDARLELRLPEVEHALINRAASYANQSLSGFVRQILVPAAEAIIKEHETIMLAEDDWTRFYDALQNPPEPNAALQAAAAEWASSPR